PEKGALASDKAHRQVFREDALVECRANEAARQGGLDLGGTHEAGRSHGGVQRLDAEAVSREQQPAQPTVPDREGEHSLKLIDDSVTCFLVQMKDAFGVAPRSVGVATDLRAL